MKRTTLYLEPELEVRLKLEALRLKKPMAEVIREALHAYFKQRPRKLPPGRGAFDSGRTDTAERAEQLLRKLKFGDESG